MQGITGVFEEERTASQEATTLLDSKVL